MRSYTRASRLAWRIAHGCTIVPVAVCVGDVPEHWPRAARCTRNSADNPNAPEFCNTGFDALVARAERAEEAAPAAATQRWATVDRALVNAAPWVPLVNPSWVHALSKRAHNYVRSPVLGPFFDLMWVH
jgi:ABC-type oligopeptide transport system substrate-binding subunit